MIEVLFDVEYIAGCRYTMVECTPCQRTIYYVAKDKYLDNQFVHQYAERDGTRLRVHLPYIQFLVKTRNLGDCWMGKHPYVSCTLDPFSDGKVCVPPFKNVGLDSAACLGAQYGSTSRGAVANVIHAFWNTTFNEDMGDAYEDRDALAFWNMKNPGWYNDFNFYRVDCLRMAFPMGAPIIRREPL